MVKFCLFSNSWIWKFAINKRWQSGFNLKHIWLYTEKLSFTVKLKIKAQAKSPKKSFNIFNFGYMMWYFKLAFIRVSPCLREINVIIISNLTEEGKRMFYFIMLCATISLVLNMFISSINLFHCLGLGWPDGCLGRENRF